MSTTSISSFTPVADIPRRLFGSFVEQLGRSVYGGIYEPTHPTADENGFRQDVLDLVKELGVTCVRYPGGNIVSNYRWEDGTGPRELRPVRRELAWHQTETNEVGIDDFYRWSKKAGTEIMLAVNMGTRGLQEALDELEYVNGAPGTTIADRRVANGIPEPMNIAMWCIGNEMDGPWQVGHMTAEEYASRVEKVAHAMKLAESGLEMVACGSSSAQMPTFGTWEKTVLTRAYEYLSFVSAHAYYYDHDHDSHKPEGMREFLASSEDMKQFIATVASCADYAREQNHGTKDIAISFDEWGVWYQDVWQKQEAEWKAAETEGLHTEPWPKAPHLLEDVYTASDAVVEGSLMITLLKHCDRVRSASRAQLVNVIAPIMAEENGPAWKQTIYYPFAEVANHARGVAYVPAVDGPTFHTETYGDVQALESVVTWDEATREGLILAVNRDPDAAHEVTIDVASLPGADAARFAVTHAEVLHDDDPYRQNTAENPLAVTPQELTVATDGAAVSYELPSIAWSAVRFTA
ncbi:alpha-L-arabinofuranosidase [Bifidobacterium imperatoris]|uniref:non-reducing end alpha-L-arabinofuranosidase n=1 Tax=Bifidobacterium imperatoris TaxID=2020965 RepID=A0A2N5IR74_9BIFI|nr:alpha-L-arabinofuranosidase C-terminal domain-containing protein [Bifidobacterium imperatoris]PLS24463.1 alpha-L-arabinofuranosidase [Bifidobacterium imperatoris]QSY58116.1 alpha-L-arabinofuranosidase [Bifidobacterium imperatoris]